MVTAEFSVAAESPEGMSQRDLVTTLRIEDERGGTSLADKLEGFRSPRLEPRQLLSTR